MKKLAAIALIVTLSAALFAPALAGDGPHRRGQYGALSYIREHRRRISGADKKPGAFGTTAEIQYHISRRNNHA